MNALLGNLWIDFVPTLLSAMVTNFEISFIALVDGPWDIASGLITPTLKLKRNAIEKRYASHVDEWIAMQKPVLWARGL